VARDGCGSLAMAIEVGLPWFPPPSSYGGFLKNKNKNDNKIKSKNLCKRA
jgi:hypothetical protein